MGTVGSALAASTAACLVRLETAHGPAVCRRRCSGTFAGQRRGPKPGVRVAAASDGLGFLQDGSGLTYWSVTDAGAASSRGIEPPRRSAKGAVRPDGVAPGIVMMSAARGPGRSCWTGRRSRGRAALVFPDGRVCWHISISLGPDLDIEPHVDAPGGPLGWDPRVRSIWPGREDIGILLADPS